MDPDTDETPNESLQPTRDLIIGVATDLPYPQTIPLPESFLGFRVMQFCGGAGTACCEATPSFWDVQNNETPPRD